MNEFKQRIKKLILISGDILLLYLSLFIVLKMRLGMAYNPDILWQHLFPFSIVYSFWLVVFYINNLYSIDYARNTYGFYASVIKSFLFNSAISVIFFYIVYSSTGLTPKTNLLLNITIFAVLFISWRIFYNYFIGTRAFTVNILILSDDAEAKEIIEKIKTNPQLGYNIVSHPQNDIKNLKKFILENNIKIAITSEKLREDHELTQELYESLSLKIKFENLPNFYEQVLSKIPISIIGRIWFLENIKNLDRSFYDISKRAIDIILSLILSVPTLAIFPFIALAIKLQDWGPIFYRQKRIGKDGKEFIIIKFRTMKTDSGENGPKFTEKNDNRITRIGKLMRDARIDELPQIINILGGEMSFIGPRPERPEFVQEFQKQIPFYNFRHIVKPGLTGWAQVNYEYGDSIEDAYKKLQYDLFYIKYKSLILDIDTALKTIQIIINRKGR